MKCFIFLLYANLLLIGKFMPLAASPAPAAAAEAGRTASKQEGTFTTAQNTNRNQKRIGDDNGAGPSKKQKKSPARSITRTAEETCYGLKLQLLLIFWERSQSECYRACEGQRQAYRNFLRNEGLRPTGSRGCIRSSICVNTKLLFVKELCVLSLCLTNERSYQCYCEATLTAFRIRNVLPSNMYLLTQYINDVKNQRQPSTYGLTCYHIFMAARLTQPGWTLTSAAWNPFVNCDGDSSEAIEREELCACVIGGHKPDGGECTANISAHMIIRLPLSIFGIDLNKEPARHSVAAATSSSQQPNHNLQYTQTFSNNDLDQNGVCINPTIAQFGYCSSKP